MSRALTMDEAADELRIKRRSFQEIVKRYPFYYPNGRRKLFTDADIAAYREVLGQSPAISGKGPLQPFSRVIPAGDHSWVWDLAAQSKKRASKAGIFYNLSDEDLLNLSLRCRRKCELSGIDLDFTIFGNGKRNPFRPSIDRKDNAKGYEFRNVRIVCALANFAMNEWGEVPLRRFVEVMSTRIAGRTQCRS